MTKELWFNLPVKDVKASLEFFTKIGFRQNTHFPATDQSCSVFIGEKKIVMMLFAESVFKNFTSHNITDTAMSTEVLFSIDAASREEVDGLAAKVQSAGGNVFAAPGENQGWMYGCCFTDLDGHRWNVLYMDMSKMPAG